MAKFQPGESGNPRGKPPGTRSRFSEAFIQALAADFAEHGASVIEACRTERAGEYLRICAAVLAKNMPGDTPAIDLGDTSTPAGIVESMNRIVRAVATSELTADQAKALSDIIETQRRSIELSELESRLKEIESRAGINGASSSHANNQGARRQ